MGELREILKLRTAPIHARVEQTMPVPNAGSTAREYRAYLSKMYGIIKPLERALENFPTLRGPPVSIDRRRKSPLLEHDLRQLAPEVALDTYAECAELPALDEPARALGCLYVLEGSTLGGRVILRGLGDRFESARRFLTAYGPETATMWQSLLGELEKTGSEEREAVIEAACDTFAAFERWLANASPSVSPPEAAV